MLEDAFNIDEDLSFKKVLTKVQKVCKQTTCGSTWKFVVFSICLAILNNTNSSRNLFNHFMLYNI